MIIPKLSIIIASRDARETIDNCLRSIERQKERDSAEVIVVDCSSDGTAGFVKRNYPKVLLLENENKLSSDRLKAIGILESCGDIIAITEPYCVVADNWFSSILKAHNLEHGVISGAVEPVDFKNVASWSTYYCEYGQFMLPIEKGMHNEMAGNNISYKRVVLEEHFDDIRKRGFWKVFLQWKLTENGVSIISDPDILVYDNRNSSFFKFFQKRYYYGRCFGGMRQTKLSGRERLFFICIFPLLPFLFMFRGAKQIIPKKRFLKEYIKSMPFLFLYFLNWSIGELCGYIFGVGDSCKKVY